MTATVAVDWRELPRAPWAPAEVRHFEGMPWGWDVCYLRQAERVLRALGYNAPFVISVEAGACAPAAVSEAGSTGRGPVVLVAPVCAGDYEPTATVEEGTKAHLARYAAMNPIKTVGICTWPIPGLGEAVA